MMKDAVAEYRQRQRQARQGRRGPGEGVVQSCETQVVPDPECGGGSGGGEIGGSTEYGDDVSWTGNDEFTFDPSWVPTVQEEADSLQATPAEVDRLVYYENLALGNTGGYELMGTEPALSRDEMIRRAASGALPGEVVLQGWGEVIAVPIGVIGVCAVRALFAYHRAKSAAASYYPNLDPGDTRHDAFRHVYASVMLHRYCTSSVAKMITDANEWGNPNWGARVMDYHNNDLGREVKYRHFRGHWFWDRWSWGVWGHNVRRYINDPLNGAFTPSLLDPTLSESAARSIRNSVPAMKYIYIREQ